MSHIPTVSPFHPLLAGKGAVRLALLWLNCLTVCWRIHSHALSWAIVVPLSGEEHGVFVGCISFFCVCLGGDLGFRVSYWNNVRQMMAVLYKVELVLCLQWCKNYAFIPVSITDSNCLCDINMKSSLQWKLMSVEFFSSSVDIYLNDYARPFILTSWNTCRVEEQVHFLFHISYLDEVS